MEFTLDFSTIRRIVSQERAQARSEIEALGPLAAFKHSLQRHDRRLVEAPDANTLACRAGCSWCCHFSIELRPVEAIHIAEFVARELSPAERQRVLQEAASNDVLLHALDEIERMRRNVKCPFLNEGRCTIYAARPQTCRNYHATDVTGCRRSFEEPDNLDIDPDYAPLVYQSGNAHVDAFTKELADAGYDVEAYELNATLVRTLNDPETVQARFDAKRKAFDMQGMDVPLEFLDLQG